MDNEIRTDNEIFSFHIKTSPAGAETNWQDSLLNILYFPNSIFMTLIGQ